MTAAVVWPRTAPPSAGAHRLAWWIADEPDGDVAFVDLATASGLSVAAIDRFLSGAVLPGADAATGIEALTCGAVRWSDWDAPADGGWAVRPAARGRGA